MPSRRDVLKGAGALAAGVYIEDKINQAFGDGNSSFLDYWTPDTGSHEFAYSVSFQDGRTEPQEPATQPDSSGVADDPDEQTGYSKSQSGSSGSAQGLNPDVEGILEKPRGVKPSEAKVVADFLSQTNADEELGYTPGTEDVYWRVTSSQDGGVMYNPAVAVSDGSNDLRLFDYDLGVGNSD